jgi:hypothetical protein
LPLGEGVREGGRHPGSRFAAVASGGCRMAAAELAVAATTFVRFLADLQLPWAIQ